MEKNSWKDEVQRHLGGLVQAFAQRKDSKALAEFFSNLRNELAQTETVRLKAFSKYWYREKRLLALQDVSAKSKQKSRNGPRENTLSLTSRQIKGGFDVDSILSITDAWDLEAEQLEILKDDIQRCLNEDRDFFKSNRVDDIASPDDELAAAENAFDSVDRNANGAYRVFKKQVLALRLEQLAPAAKLHCAGRSIREDGIATTYLSEQRWANLPLEERKRKHEKLGRYRCHGKKWLLLNDPAITLSFSHIPSDHRCFNEFERQSPRKIEAFDAIVNTLQAMDIIDDLRKLFCRQLIRRGIAKHHPKRCFCRGTDVTLDEAATASSIESPAHIIVDIERPQGGEGAAVDDHLHAGLHEGVHPHGDGHEAQDLHEEHVHDRQGEQVHEEPQAHEVEDTHSTPQPHTNWPEDIHSEVMPRRPGQPISQKRPYESEPTADVASTAFKRRCFESHHTVNEGQPTPLSHGRDSSADDNEQSEESSPSIPTYATVYGYSAETACHGGPAPSLNRRQNASGSDGANNRGTPFSILAQPVVNLDSLPAFPAAPPMISNNRLPLFQQPPASDEQARVTDESQQPYQPSCSSDFRMPTFDLILNQQQSDHTHVTPDLNELITEAPQPHDVDFVPDLDQLITQAQQSHSINFIPDLDQLITQAQQPHGVDFVPDLDQLITEAQQPHDVGFIPDLDQLITQAQQPHGVDFVPDLDQLITQTQQPHGIDFVPDLDQLITEHSSPTMSISFLI